MTRLDPTNPDHPHGLLLLADDFEAAARRGLPPPAGMPHALRAALAVVAALAMWAAVAIGVPSPAGADVTVTTADGQVTVELRDHATPEDVSAALERAGVVAKVVDVPTGPSAVGQFVTLHTTRPSVRVGCHDDPCPTRAVRFTEGDTATIGVGVPTEPGQPYEYFTDGFAPGEPFEELAHLRDADIADVLDVLEAHATAAGVQLRTSTEGQPVVAAVLMTSADSGYVLLR